jgi:hypothetical protein
MSVSVTVLGQTWPDASYQPRETRFAELNGVVRSDEDWQSLRFIVQL